jgi:hypothetical protein
MFSRSSHLRDGLVVGLIAYASVILVYTVLDLLSGRGPFFTVNLLGYAVVAGPGAGVDLSAPFNVTAVALFNGIHFVVSLAIGVTVLQLVAFAEREQSQALVVMLALVSGFAVTVAAIGWWSAPFREHFSWASIILANVVAVSFSTVYLLRTRPDVMDQVVPHRHG